MKTVLLLTCLYGKDNVLFKTVVFNIYLLMTMYYRHIINVYVFVFFLPLFFNLLIYLSKRNRYRIDIYRYKS